MSETNKIMENSQKHKIYIIIAIAAAVALIAGVWIWQNRTERSEQLPEDVVARVGDEDITEEFFSLRLWDATKEGTPENPEGYTNELKEEVLERSIEALLIRQKAEELGISATNQEIEERIQERGFANNDLARYNIETMILREGLIEELITTVEGEYINIRFDKYFADWPEPTWTAQELTAVRENRKNLSRELREHADSLTEQLYQDLAANRITFQEAMDVVDNDPMLDNEFWAQLGSPLTGKFVIDEMSPNPTGGMLATAMSVNKPTTIEPFVKDLPYFKDPRNGLFPHLAEDEDKIEKRPGMWVILNVTDINHGEFGTLDEWLDSEKARKVEVRDDMGPFLSRNLIQTAQAVHSVSNRARTCYSSNSGIPTNELASNYGASITRTMYVTSSGGGPYNLNASLRASSNAGGGCDRTSEESSNQSCHFNNPNTNTDRDLWCCSGNPIRMSENTALSGYTWVHLDRYRVSNSGTSLIESNVGFDGSTYSFNIRNGYTDFITIYAQEDYVPPDLDPATLIVRAMVGGVLTSGVTITQISGSPSGLGGTTGLDGTYTREHPNMDISNARLRAPATAVGNDGTEGVFQDWQGCDSISGRDCWITVPEDAREMVTARYQACTGFDSVTCHNGNEWWVDACGRLQEMKANCGTTTEEDPTQICRDGGGAQEWNGDLNLHVWDRIRVHERGCRNNSCYYEATWRYEFNEDCDGYSCADGKCLPPITELEFTADPMSGEEPLDVELKTVVKGTSRGPIVYNIWWDCDLATNNVSTAEGSCGALPVVGSGACASNANGYRCNNVSNETLTVTHRYFAEEVTPGTPFSPGEYATAYYYPKVIVERDAAKGGENATKVISLRVDPLEIPDQLPPPATEDDADPYVQKELSLVIHRILTTMVVISTSAFALMIVIGGAYLIFAGASPAALSAAKAVFMYAAIGYGVVLVAWMLMGALVGML